MSAVRLFNSGAGINFSTPSVESLSPLQETIRKASAMDDSKFLEVLEQVLTPETALDTLKTLQSELPELIRKDPNTTCDFWGFGLWDTLSKVLNIVYEMDLARKVDSVEIYGALVRLTLIARESLKCRKEDYKPSLIQQKRPSSNMEAELLTPIIMFAFGNSDKKFYSRFVEEASSRSLKTFLVREELHLGCALLKKDKCDTNLLKRFDAAECLIDSLQQLGKAIEISKVLGSDRFSSISFAAVDELQ